MLTLKKLTHQEAKRIYLLKKEELLEDLKSNLICLLRVQPRLHLTQKNLSLKHLKEIIDKCEQVTILNRGVHIWKVENHTINLVAGTTAYQLPGNTDDILEAVFRNNNVDTTMTQVSRSEYLQIPNKFSQGTPSQYYIQQEIFTSNGHANVTINLYLTPNVTDTQINFNYMARIQDAGSYTNIPDIYYTFYPCLTSGLAFYLSQKYNPAKTQELKMYYEDELNRALIEGSQSTSVHLTPSNFFVSGS